MAEVLGSTMTTTRVLTACSAGGMTTAMTPPDTETSVTADQRGSPSANILSDAYTFRIQSGKYASESSQTRKSHIYVTQKLHINVRKTSGEKIQKLDEEKLLSHALK